ncbi:MAG: hypothetical protein COB67_13540 [SAR324 cluster bacterium]|uniref:Uncharacterized protein n=1 Tax=SAR324 cluster bacterium TaxID=2024889 RepID=A0A2A4SMD3_9DELT|nr:MAG: hypothetical protein COB67_13540 [SAR324 cluster bacterium]
MINLENQKHLLGCIEKLPVVERVLLGLISIIYEPVTECQIRGCFKRVTSLHNAAELTEKELNQALKHLHLIGLINKKNECHIDIIEEVTASSIKLRQFEEFAAAVMEEFDQTYWEKHSLPQVLRELRLGIYAQDFYRKSQALDILWNEFSINFKQKSPIDHIRNGRPYASWLAAMPLPSQLEILTELLHEEIEKLAPCAATLQLLEQISNQLPRPQRNSYRDVIATYRILRGENSMVERIIQEDDGNFPHLEVKAWLEVLHGKMDAGISLYTQALQYITENTGRKKPMMGYMKGLFYILALLTSPHRHSEIEAERYLNLIDQEIGNFPSHLALKFLNETQRGVALNTEKHHFTKIAQQKTDYISLLFYGLVCYWTHQQEIQPLVRKLIQAQKLAGSNHYLWLEMEYAQLIYHLNPAETKYAKIAARLRKQLGFKSITRALPQRG